jgi:pimeloyl-ACP methyl ester carboxylesterase
MEHEPRSPIVLVPGACLGGWAWREVAARLRTLGHEVYPVTLTGLGERVHLASRDVDLETHIADVVNLLDYEDLSDAILVGHSYAGVVVTAVADRRPERLQAVVYLDTGPLPDGMAIVDVQSTEQRERQRREANRDGDGWLWPVPDRDILVSGAYGSASGLEAAALRRAAIFCSEGGMSLALLRELIEQHDPRADVFADPSWELHELPTGHWAMFSLPCPLAELLDRIAAAPVG